MVLNCRARPSRLAARSTSTIGGGAGGHRCRRATRRVTKRTLTALVLSAVVLAGITTPPCRPRRRAKPKAVEAHHDRGRRLPARPQQHDDRRQRRLDRDDRRSGAGPGLQAHARLLVPALALRQGLRGHRAEPLHRRLPDPARGQVVRRRPDHVERLQVHLRHDHEHQERRRVPRRVRQDHARST